MFILNVDLQNNYISQFRGLIEVLTIEIEKTKSGLSLENKI
jgi:hypothetical protein